MRRERRTIGSGRAWSARWAMVGGVAAFLASAFPAVASATDYCVAPVTGCSGTPVQHFEDALGAADGNADADRIFLGATTYVAPTASGFDYNTPNARVEIIGQGRGQTILTSPAGGNSWVLRLVGGPGTSIHDLTIRLPQSASAGLAGLWTKNTARRVDVVEDSTQANPRSGVELVNGGVLEDSKVTLSGWGGRPRGSLLARRGHGAPFRVERLDRRHERLRRHDRALANYRAGRRRQRGAEPDHDHRQSDPPHTGIQHRHHRGDEYRLPDRSERRRSHDRRTGGDEHRRGVSLNAGRRERQRQPDQLCRPRRLRDVLRRLVRRPGEDRRLLLRL